MQIYTAIIQLFHYLASINSNSFNNGIIIINITYSNESKYSIKLILHILSTERENLFWTQQS